MNKEYIKEKLVSLRLYLTIVATLDSACIAWFVSYFNKAGKILIIYNILAIVILTGIFVTLTLKIIYDSKKLKGES